MPRNPMDQAEIAEKKEKILDIAAEIIMDDGYQNLSSKRSMNPILSNRYNRAKYHQLFFENLDLSMY